MGWIGILLLISIRALVAARESYSTTLAPKAFLTLPLGDVKPEGWVSKHLATNESALGTADDFYDYLSRTATKWPARPTHAYTVELAGSHWFYDTVTAGGTLGIPTLRSLAEQFLDYFLDEQGSDGWLGPEVFTTEPRRLAGRFPFLLGAIRLAEAQPARAVRIATALHSFAGLANGMLRRGTGMEDDTWSLAGDFLVVLRSRESDRRVHSSRLCLTRSYRLYDFHPGGQEEILFDTMSMLTRELAGAHAFREDNFPTVDLSEPWWKPAPGIDWRGMNMAKSLVSVAAGYRVSSNRTELDAVSASWDSISWHPAGMPDAIQNYRPPFFDEPERVHLIAEMIRSTLYLYQVSGDPKYADRAERILHNALRATGRDTWWIACGLPSCEGQALWDDGRLGAYTSFSVQFAGMDELCCTRTQPEGWADFVHNAFLATTDKKALVNTFLGPFAVNTTLAEDNQVSVVVNTTYPHGSDIVTTTIVAQRDFDYYVRIPGWSNGGEISVNGSDFRPCNTVQGLQSIHISPGVTNITLKAQIPMYTDQRPLGQISILRGPLLYVYEQTRLVGLSSLQRSDDNIDVCAGAHRYAIDPSTLTIVSGGTPAWNTRLPIVDHELAVAGCPVALHSSKEDPFAFEELREVSCVCPVRNFTLSPLSQVGTMNGKKVTAEFSSLSLRHSG